MVQGRVETLHGVAWGETEERYDRQGQRVAVFQICVESFREGREWYTIFASGRLASFALGQVKNRGQCKVQGSVREESWRTKDGTMKIRKLLNAFRLEVGEQACIEKVPEMKPEVREPNEKECVAAFVAEMEQHPPRWMRPEFLANHPECEPMQQETAKRLAALRAEHDL